MAGFGFGNVGFVGSLPLGATVAAGRPIPLLYRASSLAAAGAGGSLSAWPNQGSSGAAYDLAIRPGGTAAPTFLAAAGGFPAAVRFTDQHFQSGTTVPASITGSADRTVGFCAMLSVDANQNFMGYGAGLYASMFDLMSYNASYLAPHFNGGQLSSTTRNNVGVFQSVITRLTIVSANVLQVDIYLDGVLNFTATGGLLNTAASLLFVGGGIYPSYNGTTTRQVSGAFVADYAMTTAEMQAALTLIKT